MPYYLPQKRSLQALLGLIVTATIVLSVGFWYQTHVVKAAAIVWDGGGTDGTCGGLAGDGNKWSCALNWSGDVVPGVADVATFDGTSTKDVTIDSAISVSGIDVNAGYTGTMTQAASMSIGEGDWDMDDGAFVGGSDPITITGFFDIDNITFTSTSGTFTVQENFGIANDATFLHNNGTVVFKADSTSRNISPSGGVDLYDVEFNATSNINTFRPTGIGNLTVLNSLTFTNGEMDTVGGGEVITGVNPTFAATFDGGNGRLRLTGTASVAPATGTILCGIIVDEAGTSFTGPGIGTTVTLEGALEVVNGTINAGAGTINLETGLTIQPTGTFNHDNGTIAFTGSTVSSINADSAGAGTMTLYNVTVNKSTNTTNAIINEGDTIVVLNTATLTNGQLMTSGTITGVMEIDGTVSIAGTFDGGTGVLDLQVATSLAPAAGAFLPGFYLTNPGSDFTGPGSGVVTIEGPVDLVSSTFNAGAGTIQFEDDLVIPAGSTFNNDGGTIEFDHTSSGDLVQLDSTLSLNNVTLLGGGLNLDTGDEIDVAGLLTLTDGQFDIGTMNVNGTFSIAGTFDGGTGLIVFNTVQTIVMTDGMDLPGVELTVATSSITGAGAATSNIFGGDIILQTGTTLNAGAGTLILYGGIDVSGGGAFNHDSGTIQLAEGTWNTTLTHYFVGNLTFNNFTGLYTHFKELIFDATSNYVVEGDFHLEVEDGEGDPNDRALLTVETDSPGVAVSLDVQDATPQIFAADVRDINNSGTTIPCVVQCTNSGNNTGWYFGQPGIIVSDISGDTTEAGGTATFSVVLRNEPLDDVDVAIASLNTAEGTVSDAVLTFTAGNWDIAQVVTVTGEDDAVNDGGVTYTISVGPATSVGDSGYDGLEAPDVTVLNEDNDGSLTGEGMDFEAEASFSNENIAENIGATWFSHDYFGLGYLMTGEFGTEINLTDTGVLAGCRMDVDGTEWIISSVYADQVGNPGSLRLVDDPASRVEVLNTMLSGPVTYIECSRVAPNGLQFLTDDLVGVRGSMEPSFESAGYVMVHDSDANTIWSDGTASTRIQLPGLTYDDFTRQAGVEPKMALDPSRGEIWYPNQSSGTVTKFDTTTGAGTNYATAPNCESAEYDPTNDRIWLLCAMTSGTADALVVVNPATGGVVDTITIEANGSAGSYSTAGLVYDSYHDRIWASIDNGETIVAVDADTHAYSFGSLAASTFDTYHVNTSFANVKTPLYVAETNTVWMINAQCDGYGDVITILNADTGYPVGYIEVPGCPASGVIDIANGSAWYTSDWEGTLTEIRLSDNTVVEHHAGLLYDSPGYPVTVDSIGSVWTMQCCDPGLYEFVRNGVPWDHYYTNISNDSAQIDTTGWTGIEGTVVNETLNGQTINYAVSFDGRKSFVVFGSQRYIVSNQASIHGGIDGDWYYRDNGSTWTPAPSNTAEEAMSLAVAAGANNQMSGAEMEALVAADWETLGFEPGTTTTLDIAATLFSNDPHDAPSVQSIEFTLGAATSGGSGSSHSFVSNASVSAPGCSASTEVTISMEASNATMVMISNDGTFDSEAWEPFFANITTETRNLGDDGRLIETMEKEWILDEGDGEKTVSVKYRTASGNESSTYTTHIVLDEVGECGEGVVPDDTGTEEPGAGTGRDDGFVLGCDLILREKRSSDEGLQPSDWGIGVVAPLSSDVGISPIHGGLEPISVIYPGDLFRGYGYSTVYCLHEDLTRHAFIDEISYFTHERTFENVKWVTDATLSRYLLSDPVLPRPDVILGKFESDPRVYRIDIDPEDPTNLILRHIDDESIAIDSYGPHWADYVIDLNPTTALLFTYGPSIIEPELVDTSEFRKRVLLNEQNATQESDNEGLFTIVAQLLSSGFARLKMSIGNLWPW